MTTEQREPLYASTAKPWLKYYDQKYIDMPLPKCSAFEYLCHQNKNHLSETALEYYGRKFTFADLFVNVKKTAAAFRALGVKKGDIITEFAGETVTSADDLNAIKAKQTSGDTVSVKIDRNGKTLTLDLVVPQPTDVDTSSSK